MHSPGSDEVCMFWCVSYCDNENVGFNINNNFESICENVTVSISVGLSGLWDWFGQHFAAGIFWIVGNVFLCSMFTV